MAKKKTAETSPTAELVVIENKALGRPTEYDPKYVQALLDYFDVKPYEQRLEDIVTSKGDVITIKKDVASDFKTLAGFAVSIGFHRDTLHKWSQDFPEFSDAYKRAKDFQENFLAVNGNKGLISPAFGIFTAKNVLNWRDKKDIDHSGFIKDISDEDLDQQIQDKMKAIGEAK